MDYVIRLLQLYTDNYALIILYFITWMVIVILEKDQDKKIGMALSSVWLMIIVFNPLVGNVLDSWNVKMDHWHILPERVVRIFWLLPVYWVIAYGFVLVMQKMKNESTKTIYIIVILVLLLCTGKYVNTQETFFKPNNWYKLPDGVTQVVDLIVADAQLCGCGYEEAKSILPVELATYARQYDGRLLLLYGRYPHEQEEELLESSINVYEEMTKEAVDVGYIVGVAQERNCRYLVLDSTKEWLNMPQDDSLQLIGTSGDYCLYRLN